MVFKRFWFWGHRHNHRTDECEILSDAKVRKLCSSRDKSTAGLDAQYEPTKINSRKNRKSYNNPEITVGKLSKKRIQICSSYFCKNYFWPLIF